MRAPLRFFIVLWLLACSPQVVGQNAANVSPAVSAPSQWEPDIAQFEAQDRASPPRPGSIVFVGSSSIRMWATLDRDFPGVPVLNRGFGGSEAGDVGQFAERIVVPYKPPVVVFYAGDNDLAAGKTPAQVLDAFRSFVATMHRELPSTRVVFVSIKPSIASGTSSTRCAQRISLFEITCVPMTSSSTSMCSVLCSTHPVSRGGSCTSKTACT